MGRLNFAFDRSHHPHVSADQIAGALCPAKSTMSAKASQIASLLGLGHFDPQLCRAELLERHPLAWLVAVDGVIVDARMLPPELQHQAHQHGLIPFIPRHAD